MDKLAECFSSPRVSMAMANTQDYDTCLCLGAFCWPGYGIESDCYNLFPPKRAIDTGSRGCSSCFAQSLRRVQSNDAKQCPGTEELIHRACFICPNLIIATQLLRYLHGGQQRLLDDFVVEERGCKLPQPLARLAHVAAAGVLLHAPNIFKPSTSSRT